MGRRSSQDVVEIFQKLKKTLGTKPPIEKMFEEVRMMQFKIKPISGDISLLELKNKQLVEVLWSLGKLDEVFQKEFKNLTQEKKEIFFRLFDDLYWQFQQQLNKIRVKPKTVSNTPQILEMEIFKDRSALKKLN